jgi:hypothetical protein
MSQSHHAWLQNGAKMQPGAYGLPDKGGIKFRLLFPRFYILCSFEKSGKIKRAQGVRFLFWLKEQIFLAIGLRVY